jgi:hypothetical protein
MPMALQALKNGVVLAVHGQDVHALGRSRSHHGFSSHDQDFLASHSQIHAALHGCQGRRKARSAYDGHQHHISP